MSDTIKRWECPECGRWIVQKGFLEHNAGDRRCPGVPVERTYVAVDALLSDETRRIVAERLDDDVLAKWPGVALRRANAYARAAIAAVTGEDAA